MAEETKTVEAARGNLKERVGEVIAEMHADGTLSELSMKWYGEDLTEDPTQ